MHVLARTAAGNNNASVAVRTRSSKCVFVGLAHSAHYALRTWTPALGSGAAGKPFPPDSRIWKQCSILWNKAIGSLSVIVVGTDVVERYFAARGGHKGIKAARAQYDAWRGIAETAQWTTPEEVKKSHPKASILKGS